MLRSLLLLLAVACEVATDTPKTVEICGNLEDDDGNGQIDCEDEACVATCNEICNDGRDNNADGLVDCDDPSCDGLCAEVCGDGRDNDADGSVDCDDLDCFGSCPEICDDNRDNDGDGLTDCLDPDCVVETCAEVCTDGRDNDADTLVDCLDDDCNHPDCPEDCTDGRDNDGDGRADCDDTDCDGDCPEVCDDGRDNDADALVDCDDVDECGTFCDADGDGFLREDLGGDDCDDSRFDVNPSRPEVCNDGEALDDDCDGDIDQADSSFDEATLTAWYIDNDRDGHGTGVPLAACSRPPGRVPSDLDCDDTNPAVHGLANEVCDGFDNDCDRLVDEDDPSVDITTRETWYRDRDADGFGVPGESIEACTPPIGYAPNDDDCNDRNPGVGPPSLWLPDLDDDGFGAGDPYSLDLTCDPPADGLAPDWVGEDCNDDQRTIYPGAPEVCEDGRDQDCDGYDMLCVAPNPECSSYRIADQSWRNVSSVGPVYCDSSVLSLPNWYRFQAPAGTRMPEAPPGEYHCGTHAPGWLEGTHPTILGDTRDIRVCFQWSGSTCLWSSTVRVTYCGGYDDFYVYYLPVLPFGCNGTYCAE